MPKVDENRILLEAGEFSVEILPALGGKIASIRAYGRELLQSPLAERQVRSRAMPFEAGDASGWDECLPSVAACEVTTLAGTVAIPDHGDLWRVPWSVSAASAKQCTMTGRCFSLPLELQRTAVLHSLANSHQLILEYTLRNFGDHATPWCWAAHPLFAVEPGDRILLPKTIQSVQVEASCSGRMGKPGTRVAWPTAALADAGRADLGVIQPPAAGIGDKLFAGPLAADENWCALERKSIGLRIQTSFDPAATPFLGLWLCYGGWPLRPGPKQMCIALEPATTPADSLAKAGKWTRTLPPGETATWTTAVEFLQIG